MTERSLSTRRHPDTTRRRFSFPCPLLRQIQAVSLRRRRAGRRGRLVMGRWIRWTTWYLSWNSSRTASESTEKQDGMPGSKRPARQGRESVIMKAGSGPAGKPRASSTVRQIAVVAIHSTWSALLDSLGHCAKSILSETRYTNRYRPPLTRQCQCLGTVRVSFQPPHPCYISLLHSHLLS